MNDPASVVLGATERETLEEAIAWIAEGHPLNPESGLRAVLQAIIALDRKSADAEQAIRRLAREISQSDLDTASVLLNVDAITPPTYYRSALDTLAWKNQSRSGRGQVGLVGLTAEVVAQAQRANPYVMETLCAVAGLTYRDLRERVRVELPQHPRGTWSNAQISAAFAVIDEIVCGTAMTGLKGSRPAQPAELVFNDFGPTFDGRGWERIEWFRRGGVPYEVLLTQRVVGGAWLAHRNSTSGLLSEALAGRLCELLDERSIEYRRSTSVGGSVGPEAIRQLVGGGRQIGVVALNENGPVAAVAFSVARDGGTASKNASRLQVMNSAKVPVCLVLAGPGWAERNDTAQLAIGFEGRIYTDRDLEQLADDIAAMVEI